MTFFAPPKKINFAWLSILIFRAQVIHQNPTGHQVCLLHESIGIVNWAARRGPKELKERRIRCLRRGG
jgi:hypothetical protein